MKQCGAGNALSLMMKSYPTYDALAMAFNPRIGALLLSDVDKAYSPKSPSFAMVSQAYGFDAAVFWVKTEMLDIDLFNATKRDADENAIIELAKLFVRKYPYIRLTEFMLFVARFKLGMYGKFYGAFDPITIGEAFRKFLTQRGHEKEKAERARVQMEIENRRRQTLSTIPEGYTSLSWYQHLKTLAAAGDSEAVELLKKPLHYETE